MREHLTKVILKKFYLEQYSSPGYWDVLEGLPGNLTLSDVSMFENTNDDVELAEQFVCYIKYASL